MNGLSAQDLVHQVDFCRRILGDVTVALVLLDGRLTGYREQQYLDRAGAIRMRPIGGHFVGYICRQQGRYMPMPPTFRRPKGFRYATFSDAVNDLLTRQLPTWQPREWEAPRWL